jgi:hypothetical protein
MPSVIAAEDLEKAAANLGRIERYFASRRSWDAASPDRFRTFRDAVRSVGEVVQDLVQLHGIPMTPPPLAPEEPLPADVLDVGRLDKFTAFVTQLAQWFEAARGHEIDAEAKPAMATVFASLAALASHLDAISATLPQPATAAAPDPLPAPAPPPAIPPPVPVDGAPTRIELFDCDETPILQTFQGEVELTDGARSLLRGFLEGHHIRYGKYHMQKFEEKVLRWVESTPDGQMLVLKIGGLSGKPEPYPSYVRRSVGEDVYSGPD